MTAAPRRLPRGFTIIELMVVMTVLGILATAAMPLAELAARRGKERELKQAVWEIRRAIDAYKLASDTGHIVKLAGGSGYPPSLSALTAGIPDVSTPEHQPIYLLRRIPRDPFAPDGAKAEQSWGVRSYASPAEAPKPGDDVFDVYSMSPAVGMNGIPYRSW